MIIAHCHPDKKHCARGLCKVCYNRWLKKHSPKYAQMCRDSFKLWVSRHKETNKSRVLKCRYGITLSQYNELKQQQKSRCLICQNINKRLVVEHNNSTNEVRGLVCDRCNTLIGYVETDKGTLFKVLAFTLRGKKEFDTRP